MTTRRDSGAAIERAIAAGDWKKARKLIQTHLRRDPNDHWLLSRMALTYYEQRQYRRALKFDLMAFKIAPYCPLAIWGYAGSLEMLGSGKKALQLYRRLLNRGEKNLAYGECGEGLRAARSLIADCHYRIARIFEKIGHRKRSLAAFASYISMRQQGARSIYSLRDAKARYMNLIGKTR